ncbi:MAG TPA: glyceraldehyde-3-phosphate dehydrogenase [Planctomycetota bacterium]|nr:glyceraldehyde-3-phosphate dehydrogenase [Planctomycetota bacterium]
MRFYARVLIAMLTAGALSAADFIDPVDGWLDASAFLREKYGFLPIPIIVTEPAVGYGGGVALAFLNEPIGGKDGTKQGPPSITMAMGAGTENGTWFAGGGHLGSYFDDQLRYVAFVGRAHLNLDYYVADRPVAYTMDGLAFIQRLTARIPSSDFFVGGRYYLIGSDISGDLLDQLPEDVSKLRTGGLGGSIAYDTLNNLLTPTKGVQLTYVGMAYAPAFGGEQEYQKYEARNRVQLPLLERLGLGLRVDGQYAAGDVPFWHQPAVDMRGISMVRYQDHAVLVGEAELRVNVYERFWLIGFGGAGAAEPEIDDLPHGEWHPAGGMGFRYLIARGFGLLVGVDVATSEDDSAVYLTVGNAWSR